MRYVLLGALLSAVSLAGAASASANVISFTYDGKIVDGADDGIFGPATPDLTGDHIRVVFVFDTSKGLRGTVAGTTDSLIGGSSVAASDPLISATITINGKSESVGGDLLAEALTDAGHFNGSGATEDLENSVDAFVYTPDAPASLDTPFTPHGDGYGSFSIDQLDPTTGDMLSASGDFSIPEPSSWALMLTGFGGVGAMLRRRRVVVA